MYKNLGELMKMTPQEVGEYIAHLEATDEVAEVTACTVPCWVGLKRRGMDDRKLYMEI